MYSCPGASSVEHNAVAEHFTDHLGRRRPLMEVCSVKLIQHLLGQVPVLKATFHVREVDHEAAHQEEDEGQLRDLHGNGGILGRWTVALVRGFLPSGLSTTYTYRSNIQYIYIPNQFQ